MHLQHNLDASCTSTVTQSAVRLQALQAQHRKQAGGIDTPTAEMFGECQELLQMFGLPYIIAPMEAEAQCAWLNGAGLVDGVVTDDNDVFLFGARNVYRWALAPLGCCWSLLCWH